jgi:hypothetical protein
MSSELRVKVGDDSLMAQDARLKTHDYRDINREAVG